MADTQIIAASLQVDTGSSNANIKEVNKNVSDLKGSLSDAGATIKNTSKTVEESAGSFGKLKDQMSALPGPLGQAGEGVGKLGQAFKALLANPVVLVIAAIVAGLALLYKAFTNTFEGGEKMEQVFGSIKAAAQALLDSLGHIAKAAYDLFTFHWGDAVDEIKGVTKAVSEAYTKTGELIKQQQELHALSLKSDLAASEREKQLSVLREQAYDDTIPIAKRKAALKQIHQDEEVNGQARIALAKQIVDNQIAQWEIEKDGALKHRDDIAKLLIGQNELETQHQNELRKIDKQVAQADKQDEADKKEAAKASQEAAKAARQKLFEYNQQLRKLQQESELLKIKDAYVKEQTALENKIDDEKRANLKAFTDGNLTKAQYKTINIELDKKAQLERDALKDTHNTEVAKNEEEFQLALNKLTNKTKLDGITDARALELAQLQVTYEEELLAAKKDYKKNAEDFAKYKQGLDANLKAAQDKLNAKNKKEDDKKKFELDEAKIKAGPGSLLERTKAEQDLIQKAFDDKVLTETEYTTKSKALSDERIAAANAEAEAKIAFDDSVGNSLSQLSELVGKQTLAGKVLAVASIIAHQAAAIGHIIMSTEEANVKAIAASPLTAGMPWVAINTAQGIIAGAASIAAGVKAVNALGGGGGGTSMPAIGSSPGATNAAPLAPTQGSTKIDQAQFDAMSNSKPVKAYVLDADVQNNRERDARLSRASRLGG